MCIRSEVQIATMCKAARTVCQNDSAWICAAVNGSLESLGIFVDVFEPGYLQRLLCSGWIEVAESLCS